MNVYIENRRCLRIRERARQLFPRSVLMQKRWIAAKYYIGVRLPKVDIGCRYGQI